MKCKPQVHDHPIDEAAENTREVEDTSWVENTPEEATYCLTMFDGRGGPEQHLDLIRDEYIALKHHLAIIRGLEPAQEEVPPSKPQAPASADLKTARIANLKHSRKVAQSFLQGERQEIGELDMVRIGAVIEIVRSERGSQTPSEKLIDHLLTEYAATGGRLTPEDTKEAFEEFELDFRDMATFGRYIAQRYPELLNSSEPVGVDASA